MAKTLESHGPPAGRLDLVFVSDGYAAIEEKLFLEQVETACRYLWGTEFYSDFRNLFNVHICFVPATKGANGVNYPFGSRYLNEAVGSTFVTRFDEATRVAQKAPGCDIVVVMSTLTGLSHGGPQTMLTSKDTGAFPHELGHTWGGWGTNTTVPAGQRIARPFRSPGPGT